MSCWNKAAAGTKLVAADLKLSPQIEWRQRMTTILALMSGNNMERLLPGLPIRLKIIRSINTFSLPISCKYCNFTPSKVPSRFEWRDFGNFYPGFWSVMFEECRSPIAPACDFLPQSDISLHNIIFDENNIFNKVHSNKLFNYKVTECPLASCKISRLEGLFKNFINFNQLLFL